jgi:hypothetical protein
MGEKHRKSNSPAYVTSMRSCCSLQAREVMQLLQTHANENTFYKEFFRSETCIDLVIILEYTDWTDCIHYFNCICLVDTKTYGQNISCFSESGKHMYNQRQFIVFSWKDGNMFKKKFSIPCNCESRNSIFSIATTLRAGLPKNSCSILDRNKTVSSSQNRPDSLWAH